MKNIVHWGFFFRVVGRFEFVLRENGSSHQISKPTGASGDKRRVWCTCDLWPTSLKSRVIREKRRKFSTHFSSLTAIDRITIFFDEMATDIVCQKFGDSWYWHLFFSIGGAFSKMEKSEFTTFFHTASFFCKIIHGS